MKTTIRMDQEDLRQAIHRWCIARNYRPVGRTDSYGTYRFTLWMLLYCLFSSLPTWLIPGRYADMVIVEVEEIPKDAS